MEIPLLITGFLDFVDILQTREHNILETGCFQFLKRCALKILEYWTTDKVQTTQ
jgi:hypothetical protein